jgi:prepilin-type N-terminal cleavage/methylation domain-containing protein
MHTLLTARRGSRGFTLIELIVVIVIMGILVAVGAFAYNSIIESSRKDAAAKSAAQFATTVQGLSAAESRLAGSVSAASRAAAVADATAAGFTVAPWPAGATAVEVKKGDYCTLVTFATSVGGKASVGTPVKDNSCGGSSAPVLADVEQGEFMAGGMGYYEPAGAAKTSDAAIARLSTAGAYTVSGTSFTKTGAAAPQRIYMSLWDSMDAVPALGKVEFTATYGVLPAGQPKQSVTMTRRLTVFVKGTIAPGSVLATRFGPAWVGKETVLPVSIAYWTGGAGAENVTYQSDTPTLITGDFTKTSLQSARASAVADLTSSGFTVTGDAGVGVSILEPSAGSSFKIENVRGLTR